MVGFTELGDINEERTSLREQLAGRGEGGGIVPKRLAIHKLCIMARGLVKRINYPIGYFSLCGFGSDKLYPVWVRFKVDAVVSDGESPNRRFYRIHRPTDGSNLSEDGVVYWMQNRFDKASKIHSFCDVPHLIKTLRNNIKNSHGHNNTRNLMVSMKCKQNILLTV